MVCGPCLFYIVTFHHGGAGTPESTVEHRQNGRKNSLSRRFSPFWRGRLLLWGSWGRAAPKPCPAPRKWRRVFPVFLPAGPCPAIAPIESSAMQKPTRSVDSEIHGPGTGAIRRVAQLAAACRARAPPGQPRAFPDLPLLSRIISSASRYPENRNNPAGGGTGCTQTSARRH